VEVEMSNNIHWPAMSWVLLAALTGGAAAQSPQAMAPAAPVPAQIASAKKVFVSNMGTDAMSTAAFKREQAENKPYNEFYAGLKTWGRYQLVDTPMDADLVFEIGFSAPIVGAGEPTAYGPQLNLSIVDAKTHFRLWTLFEPVGGALRRVTWDKNFAAGMNSLMDDLKKLSPSPGVSAEKGNK
jgi:hypothetical protein